MTALPPPARPPARRQLPASRASNPPYEIVFKKAPMPGTVFKDVLGAFSSGVALGAQVLGLAYTAGARVVLERIEGIEDARAERLARARTAPAAQPAPKNDTSSRSQ